MIYNRSIKNRKEANRMNCPNCGSPIGDNETVCPVCGKQVASVQTEIEDGYYYETEEDAIAEENYIYMDVEPSDMVQTLRGRLIASSILCTISGIMKIMFGIAVIAAVGISFFSVSSIYAVTQLIRYFPAEPWLLWAGAAAIGTLMIVMAITNFVHMGKQTLMSRQLKRFPVGVIAYLNSPGKYIVFLILNMLSDLIAIASIAFLILVVGLVSYFQILGYFVGGWIILDMILCFIGSIIAVTESPYVKRRKPTFRELERRALQFGYTKR